MNLPQITLPQLPRNFRFDVPPLANPRFEVRNSASGGTIQIFDTVGSELVNASTIRAALDKIGPRPVTIEINSPGGNVFAGISVYNMLRGHPARVTAQVLGIAASAASIIAMGAGRIEIARNAQIMIHATSMLAAGNATIMRKAAEIMEGIDAALVDTYAARTGQPASEIAQLMADETFLSSAESIELGFADALLDRDALAPPQVRNESAPSSKRDLESRLRSVGLSKSKAARLTADAWRLQDDDDEPDLERVAASLDANFQNIKSLLQSGARIHA